MPHTDLHLLQMIDILGDWYPFLAIFVGISITGVVAANISDRLRLRRLGRSLIVNVLTSGEKPYPKFPNA